MTPPHPAPPSGRRRLVLVGGGHAHVEVVRRFGRSPVPGVEVVLVSRELATPYSGMVPGHVAGHHGFADIHVDLVRLARAHGARLVHAEAVGLDRGARRLLFKRAPPLAYDLLSLDVGITPDLRSIPGAAEHALAVKPIGTFLARWEALRAACLTADGPRRLALIGGGAAGVELALAVRHRLAEDARRAGLEARFALTLVGAGPVLAGYGAGFRGRCLSALARHGIRVEVGCAEGIDPGGVRLAGGEWVEADAVLVATGAAAPPWLAGTGLALDGDGFLALEPTLQVRGEADVFAAGDCATLLASPAPKAGVFAVRQGPVLAENLRRRLAGEPLRSYRPQRRWLTLLSTGERRAIATRAPWWSAEGAWVWRWKSWLDRRWMRRYRP